ncbi:hypothetical protein INR49_025390 [Caranx melampygus]|nr:hypothetical protein INR49_025390 [Caranx melampygus]
MGHLGSLCFILVTVSWHHILDTRTTAHSLPACHKQLEFRCSNGSCITRLKLCDGHTDCGDGSDEQHCGHTGCKKKEFACLSGRCISTDFLCNGVDDCGDRSDEDLCRKRESQELRSFTPPQPQTSPTCAAAEFQCGNGQCIRHAWRCDGSSDCYDGSDELECHQNECQVNNGGCSHECVDQPMGFHCRCPDNMRLVGDTQCEDIDICLEKDVCDQLCVHVNGSLTCDCLQGYSMNPTARECKAEGEQAQVVLTSSKGIHWLSTAGTEYKVAPRLPGPGPVAALVSNRTLYLAQQGRGSIYRVSMDADPQDAIPVLKVQGSVSGLAVDWIHHLLYWTSTESGSVNIGLLDGSTQRQLITGLDKPSAVAVDPLQGLLFWAQCGSVPKIERSGLDGQDRMALVTTLLRRPVALSLDMPRQLLYWVDQGTRSISRVNLEGRDRKTVVESNGYLDHPFGLAVFEGFVYWSEEVTCSICRANKHSGTQLKVLRTDVTSPGGVVIVQPVLQPNGPSVCGRPGTMCRHKCAVTLLSERPEFSCVPPEMGRNKSEETPAISRTVPASPLSDPTFAGILSLIVFLSLLLVAMVVWWWREECSPSRALTVQSFSLKESQDPLIIQGLPMCPNSCPTKETLLKLDLDVAMASELYLIQKCLKKRRSTITFLPKGVKDNKTFPFSQDKTVKAWSSLENLDSPGIKTECPEAKERRKGQKSITVNVGGKVFHIPIRCAVKYPDTRIGSLALCKDQAKLLTLCDDYSVRQKEFFFDRDPTFFRHIYNFYTRGVLWVINEMCPINFEEEIAYWGLSLKDTHRCCCIMFEEKVDELKDNLKVEKELMAEIEVKYNDESFKDMILGNVRKCLWYVVEDPCSSPPAKAFAVFSNLFVLISIVAMALNTVEELQTYRLNGKTHMEWIENITIVFFTFEYLIRFITTPNMMIFLKSGLNFVDMVAIMPYLIQIIYAAFTDIEDLSTHEDLRAMSQAIKVSSVLKVAKLMRVFRILKLARHSTGMRAFGFTLRQCYQQAFCIFLFIALGIFLFSALLHSAERETEESPVSSIPYAWWWAAVSISTVGYGDVVPVTTLGRIVAFACISFGIILNGMPISFLFNNFSEYYAKLKGQECNTVSLKRRFHLKKRLRRRLDMCFHPSEEVDSTDSHYENLSLFEFVNDLMSDITKAQTDFTQTSSMKQSRVTILVVGGALFFFAFHLYKDIVVEKTTSLNKDVKVGRIKTKQPQSTTNSTSKKVFSWPRCEQNVSADSIPDFSSLPGNIKDFLYYRHCRHYPVLLDSPNKCGGADNSGDVFLLLVIKSSPANYDRREVLRKTWGEERLQSGVWIRRIFISGTMGSGFEKERLNKLLELENREYNDIIQWDFKDTFYNLTLKQILFLEWMKMNCPKAHFLLNGDDDVFANTDSMVEYLQSLNNNGDKHLFTGHLIQNVGPIRSPGSKYFIPKQVQESDSYPPTVVAEASFCLAIQLWSYTECPNPLPSFPLTMCIWVCVWPKQG